MTQKEKHILLVAGMHRSGTSMLARLLNLHGAYLPLEMEYGDEFNERGYWESFEVQVLNDELLRLGDSSWFDLREFSLRNQHFEQVEELRQRFKGYIYEVIEHAPSVTVVKDPRICRLVPFWRGVLEAMSIRPLAVIAFRNPLEVAASIKNRDKFSTQYCLSLWLRNVLDAELATRGIDRAFCGYTRMLSNWAGVFLHIQGQMNLADLLPVSEVQDDLDEFISGALKHWTYSESELEDYVGSDGLSLRAFQLLKQAEKCDDQATYAGFDSLRVELNRTTTILEELKHREKTNKNL